MRADPGERQKDPHLSLGSLASWPDGVNISRWGEGGREGARERGDRRPGMVSSAEGG